MKTLTTLEEIYRAKALRRKELAALPLEEKVRIMEKLREMGLAMRAARQTLSPPPARTDSTAGKK